MLTYIQSLYPCWLAVPTIKYAASKTPGLLMGAFYPKLVILITSIAFICVFVMLVLVLYIQWIAEGLVLNLWELKLKKNKNPQSHKRKKNREISQLQLQISRRK